jgi:hypothetical protein
MTATLVTANANNAIRTRGLLRDILDSRTPGSLGSFKTCMKHFTHPLSPSRTLLPYRSSKVEIDPNLRLALFMDALTRGVFGVAGFSLGSDLCQW